MCRYAFTHYKPHFACFRCRKAFKRRHRSEVDPSGDEHPARCPECGEPMAEMGLDFQAPPQGKKKQWQVLETLWEVGETFHSCGCGGPGYRPRDQAALRAYLREILVGYRHNLAAWQAEHEPRLAANRRDAIATWARRVALAAAALAAMGCHVGATAVSRSVEPGRAESSAGSTESGGRWPTSRPIEEWSGEELEQQHAAREGEDVEVVDDRAPDVDGVSHVDRVDLPEARRAVLGVDHLGIDNVYLASRDDGLVLETLYMDMQELVAIADELEAIAERTGADPPWLDDHAALVTFRPGQAMTVVSADGRRRRTLEEFQAFRGASEGHLLARFEGSRSEPAEALVLRGSAHARARLRTPRAVPASAAVLAEVRRQVGDPKLAERVLPEHLTVMDMGFRSKGSQLVGVGLFLEEVDDEWTAQLSGAFVREADGTVHTLAAVRRRHQPVDLGFVVDLDGDGIDEVAFRTDDASCGYRYLAVWDGREYRSLRLEGSGG